MCFAIVGEINIFAAQILPTLQVGPYTIMEYWVQARCLKF